MSYLIEMVFFFSSSPSASSSSSGEANSTVRSYTAKYLLYAIVSRATEPRKLAPSSPLGDRGFVVVVIASFRASFSEEEVTRLFPDDGEDEEEERDNLERGGVVAAPRRLLREEEEEETEDARNCATDGEKRERAEAVLLARSM